MRVGAIALVQRVGHRRPRGDRRRPAGEPLERRVDLHRQAVQVAQDHAARRRRERVAGQLVGARELPPLAIEVGEDLHLAAQHERVERLEQVVDGARLVAGEDLADVGLRGGQEDDRRVAAALAGLDQLRGLEAVDARASGRRAG